MNYIYGALAGIGSAALMLLLGALVRRQIGFLGNRFAVVAGVGAGLGMWALFRFLIPLPTAIADGIAIGVGVGLYQGLQPAMKQ